jgi:murein L,D-transpeptidase YafK
MPSLLARIATVAALALGLAACTAGDLRTAKHLRPISPETRAIMAERGMRMGAPILFRVFKAEAKLEVWKESARTGRYELLRTFDICRWSGDLGPKIREGDRQAPEGFYTINAGLMNPRSSFHLAINTGFPNAFDRAHNRTGSHLMIHGDCSSRGCYAMTDAHIEEIFAIARDSFGGGQRDFQMQLFPFRMTAENMWRYRNNQHIAFWRNLKEGSDHFEATGRPPQVQVCGRRYVFNRTPTREGAEFRPAEACPPSEMPEGIRFALNRRATQDAQITASLEERYRASRQPSMIATMLPTAAQPRVANATPAPVHVAFPSRQAIRAALPSASPEALSLLPGAEAGPSEELRVIARGGSIGRPVDAAEDADDAPATPAARRAAPTAIASAVPVPVPNPLRPQGAAPAAEVAEAAQGGGLFGFMAQRPAAPATEAPATPVTATLVGTLIGQASSEPRATAPASATPVPMPVPRPSAVRTAETPAPAQAETQAAEQPGLMQRFLSPFTGLRTTPVSRDAR